MIPRKARDTLEALELVLFENIRPQLRHVSRVDSRREARKCSAEAREDEVTTPEEVPVVDDEDGHGETAQVAVELGEKHVVLLALGSKRGRIALRVGRQGLCHAVR